MHVEDINTQSRYGSGVRVMRLAEGDRVVTVARTERDDSKPTEKPEADSAGEPDEETLRAMQAEEEAQQEDEE